MLRQQAKLLDRIEALKASLDGEAEPAPVEREEAIPPEEGLPVGAPAPNFALAATGGDEMSLDDLLGDDKPVLLLFVSPNCSPCKTLLPMVRPWERDYGDQITFALLSKGTLEENRKMTKYQARHLLIQGDSEVAEDYQAKWTPAAVFVSPYGRIDSHVTYGDEAIRALVSETVGISVRTRSGNGASPNGHRPQVSEHSSLRVGDPAPDFSVVDMQGETVAIEDFRGRDTLLLFWDPACPYCRSLSEDIRTWEEKPTKRAPRLVFVASGDAEKIEDASRTFKSRFLHDRESNVGHLFGTSAVPSAVLIDRDGRIASVAGIGLPNVLALAGIHKVELPIASRL